MTKYLNYLWIILLAVYIISPIDANPLFFDDLIAAAVMFYFLYKNAKQKEQQQRYSDYHGQSQAGSESRQSSTGEAEGRMTLDRAYRILGVRPGSSMEEISRAYKEKMTKSHPDKVSHLSEELQKRAQELTLELNEAYEFVRRHTKA
ncbi:MAG: DnaJ domain-containing protein [Nitrospirota bacterium]